MKNKIIKNKALIPLFLFIWFFSLSPVNAADTKPTAVNETLQQIRDRVNTALSDWQFSIDGKEWKPYTLRNTIEQESFQLKTTIKGVDTFCGVKVKGTPLYLKLTLMTQGLCEATVNITGLDSKSFDIDGFPGNEETTEKEILLTDSTAKRDYNLVINVRNKGFKPFRTEFWPPRRTPLAEDNIYFSMFKAEFHFPQADALYGEVDGWLKSMQTAYTLLNPEFLRYTFTRKPYKIEDQRLTPKERLEKLNALLQQSVAAFDVNALNQANAEKISSSIRASYQLAAPLREYAKEFKVYLIGNAHIDIAWLWRIAETVMVARNTYNTVIENMKEYPELHYAQSQALTYTWIENQYPELFEKIKQVYQKGNWEIVGGMWVEPDCNLISGESWVRQLLYGKNYFKEKFNIDVKTGWNVDSFGYNWNMPQIYKKSGIDMFVTQKIRWNDTTVFPYYIFWWEGVDGTRLLSYFPPVGYTSNVELNDVNNNITKYEATTGYKKSLILYGIGDHGGGPNKEILNRVRGYNQLYIAPEFIHSPSKDFLTQITPDMGDRIPVWKDELYLEYHRGTYTTQAKVKKGNRQSEAFISMTEKLAATANIIGNTYPREDLDEAWKLILTNQFHDILPGSSITPVYSDALETYQKAGKIMKKIMTRSMEYIAQKINTRNIKAGTPVVVFNPLSWERTDLVETVVPAASGPGDYTLLDHQGKAVPAEIEYCEDSRSLSVAFVAEALPPMGYKVYALVDAKKNPKPGNTEPGSDISDIKAEGTALENNYYKVSVNPASGNIDRLYSKALAREFVQEGKEANVLQVYEDRPENWDAWNIGYTGRMWELNKADSVKIVKKSPVRVVLEVKKSFLGLEKSRYSPTEDFPSSFFTQYITLYRGLERIDIKTEADWWESHMFLKAAFPLQITNDYATYEIPFAAIQRTTRFETLWEKARFEVAALKWADLSDSQNGLSLLNDCKYGFDIHGNVMKISLLRAPTWPDPMADRGKHTFTYSLYAHKGSWQNADTVKQGYYLNTPLVALVTDRHAGELPEVFGFFTLNADGVVLDTVKKTEKGEGYIFRLYESEGKPGKAVLDFFKTPTKIVETDLMENETREIPFTGKQVNLDFGKFEIKTLKVLF